MPELLDDRLGCHLVSCGAGTFINAKKPAGNRGKQAPHRHRRDRTPRRENRRGPVWRAYPLLCATAQARMAGISPRGMTDVFAVIATISNVAITGSGERAPRCLRGCHRDIGNPARAAVHLVIMLTCTAWRVARRVAFSVAARQALDPGMVVRIVEECHRVAVAPRHIIEYAMRGRAVQVVRPMRQEV